MGAYVMDGELERAAELDDGGDSRLLLVVGFDGSAPAQRALDSAVAMLRGRSGLLEVVYVAQLPGAAGFSAAAVAETEAGFNEEQRILMQRASSILEATGLRWHFQRRDGSAAHELLAAASELVSSGGPSDRVVLVVGGSTHRIHRYLNSVPKKILRTDRFRVVVVP